MQLRKIDGMRTGANVLDLSVHRVPRRAPIAASAGPTRTIVDGVRRQRSDLKPLLKPAEVVSSPANLTAENPSENAHTIPWRPLITATVVSAAIPFAVLAAPLMQNIQLPSFATEPIKATPPQTVPTPAVPAATAQTMTDVQATLDAFVVGKAPQGIAIINLKDGQIAGVNADKQFTSASLYKLFVAQSIYKMIDTGQLSLGSTVKGTGLSVDQCLSRMITVSDNPCGVALGTLIGWEKQNATLKAAGYTGTELYKNNDLKTTAGDTALLLKRLYDGTLLSPNNSQHFLGLLKSQKVNNRLPQGLPAGTVIAHKTGDLFGLLHDAGIVYGPNGDYIIAALSGPWPNQSQGLASFAELARQVHSQMLK